MARRRKNKKIQLSKFFTNKFFIGAFIFFLVAGVFLLIGYQIYTADFFEISKRNLKSNLNINKNIISKIEGKSIFELDLNKLHSYLIRQYPEYKEIKILKKFPNFIEIQIEKRKPIAQIRAKNFYLVDRDGVVVSQGKSNYFEGFPIITDSSFRQYLPKGKNVYSRELTAAFRLIQVIKDENLLELINSLDSDYQFKLKDINISSPETIYFYLTNQKYYQKRIKVILNRQELKEKISLLKELIKQKLKDKLSLIRYIDFRFQKVAVGFKR
ncbi:MAG: cell division protein FtsQ/DivIB [Candidatus Omnitrophica bacterium]|nr:cell division protein FtsQ/DivIB [Candidatus Omnitrophota bacterium]MCF7893596.1 cell division protein FtsQ/DivIB [Candidatus Omnitrophota bacterium]